MCNNAMVYNAPETIYYKAAKKLVLSGSKLLSPVSIIEANMLWSNSIGKKLIFLLKYKTIIKNE